uniref:Uncharacterized protein n=1 Tax=Leersia perrieri TaxID=77586 RepID=A0A0D9WPQ9_9ORYZ
MWIRFFRWPWPPTIGRVAAIPFSVSGETFTMPPAPRGICFGRLKASFTIRKGRPDLVIYPCCIGRSIQALLARPGKVLSVFPPEPYEPDGYEKFYVGELRTHGNEAALVELDDFELSNKSWFLGPLQSFCARIKGQRWDEDFGKKPYRVNYHDMLKKKFLMLTPDKFGPVHSWVDLGGVLVTRYPRLNHDASL